MAQQAAFPHPTDRRSISAPIAGIPLTKLKKDSTKGSIDISQHNSPRESPFLSPPITPVERDDVPYKPTEQDYFSLRQRRPQKARRRANRTSELSSSGAARSPPTSPASIISFDAGSVVISEQNTQHGAFNDLEILV